MKKKWSRDWESINWNEIKKRMNEVDMMLEENSGYKADIGISRDEFVEYMDWLIENEPDNFWKAILAMRLNEMGIDINIIDKICNDSVLRIEAINMIKKCSS